MADKKKTYWIGDDGDNKSVLIGRKVYTKGQEIPAGNVPDDRLEEWEAAGLISDDSRPPVIIKDTDSIKALESEIKGLKADLESLPALRKKNEALEKALDKAKSGKNAKALKDLEDDVKEKAARIDELVKQVDELTDPNAKGADEGANDSGGPS